MSNGLVICLLFFININVVHANFNVGDRVIARWKNNLYYAGKVSYISDQYKSIGVLFDDGHEITHQLADVSAVLADTAPTSIKNYDHVVAPWKGSYKQFIGFVIELGHVGDFKVFFDDLDSGWYTKDEVRILSQTSSPHSVGARVFARWSDGNYFRGFVSQSDSSTVTITYDDGDIDTLPTNDESAVILDKIPQDSELEIGQDVIGYWSSRVKYYPGSISGFCDFGRMYLVRFDDGDERCSANYEIRAVP